MFYVYELVDPRDASVFYVGKGLRDRAFQHERSARSGAPGRKCDRIRSIIASGDAVEVRIVKRFTDEAEAYRFEANRIASIGLDNLTNVSRGGGGTFALPPPRWTVATLKKLGAALTHVAVGRRVSVGPHDITDTLLGLARDAIKHMGPKRVNKVLEPLNVRLA